MVSSSLLAASHAFDPYPFMFLNLILAVFGCMMSQNRHAVKDRIDTAQDFDANLKAEIDIMALHDQLNQMRSTKLKALVEKQQNRLISWQHL